MILKFWPRRGGEEGDSLAVLRSYPSSLLSSKSYLYRVVISHRFDCTYSFSREILEYSPSISTFFAFSVSCCLCRSPRTLLFDQYSWQILSSSFQASFIFQQSLRTSLLSCSFLYDSVPSPPISLLSQNSSTYCLSYSFSVRIQAASYQVCLQSSSYSMRLAQVSPSCWHCWNKTTFFYCSSSLCSRFLPSLSEAAASFILSFSYPSFTSPIFFSFLASSSARAPTLAFFFVIFSFTRFTSWSFSARRVRQKRKSSWARKISQSRKRVFWIRVWRSDWGWGQMGKGLCICLKNQFIQLSVRSRSSRLPEVSLNRFCI